MMASDDNIAALPEALDICGYEPGKHDGMMGKRTRKLSEVSVRAQHLAGFFQGGGQSVEEEL
jgi:hypothetical protein